MSWLRTGCAHRAASVRPTWPLRNPLILLARRRPSVIRLPASGRRGPSVSHASRPTAHPNPLPWKVPQCPPNRLSARPRPVRMLGDPLPYQAVALGGREISRNSARPKSFCRQPAVCLAEWQIVPTLGIDLFFPVSFGRRAFATRWNGGRVGGHGVLFSLTLWLRNSRNLRNSRKG
jgi:hypothetical protein